MTLGALTAKLGTVVIKQEDALPFEVEVNGQPVEAIAVDYNNGIVRMFTLPYDKRKYADDGMHGTPQLTSDEEKQYALF